MTQLSKLISGAFSQEDVIKKQPLTLDSASKSDMQTGEDEDAMDAVEDFLDKSMKMDAVAAVQGWLESADDLEVGEGMADRLRGVLLAVVDEDKDGELSDDESDIFDAVREYAADYMSELGADEDDVDALINDWDDDAAERVADAISDKADVMDSIGFAFDAVKTSRFSRANAQYKKKAVVRDGQIKWIKKRVVGNVKISSKQKAALKKGSKKVWTGEMKKKLSKSMKKVWSLGLRKK